ncbi:class I SAM-dependent methyltransferase [Streptomyces sp. NPDC057245]|uniref:class I SAM-dependent methyltransferase n=1 Tax=Streptomyces TaxID=1883 RepID=UPI001C1E27F9|nr:L-histidine N(alpha)-methyltransferase [Streptomyces sp. A108]MBU6531254.1 L-histidine N(alpha)-methyltransferase [Streptomyces sp. A108]
MGEGAHPHETVAAWLRRGVLPVRYMYTGSGAALHIGFAEQYPDEYADGRCAHETDVLTRGLGRARLPAQVCDIGSSNGVHTHQFLAWFARQHRGPARYLGVDLSRELLAAARERNRPHTSVGQHFATWDMESTAPAPVDSWREPGPVLVCLFGNTLGNVEDPAQVLRNLFHAARPGDTLALGLYGPPRPDHQDDAAYGSPAVREMITGPLTAAGLPPHSLALRLETRAEAVVGTVRLTAPVSLPGARLPAGHEIRCFLSRRFHPSDAHRLLHDTGWLLRPPSAAPTDGHFVLLAERLPSPSE